MEIINTIDLWTEQYENHQECFSGAFVDGFENGKIAFDRYKIIQNCNCYITVNNPTIPIRNKQNAIVFYKNNKPVRLMVINQNTDIEKCLEVALNQSIDGKELRKLYEELKIQSNWINLQENSVYNGVEASKEIDVGSCDRWNLLYSMLKGSYTESETSYGKSENNQYEFLPDILVEYKLKTDAEKFEIKHNCAFLNEQKSRIIIIQENSPLTQR